MIRTKGFTDYLLDEQTGIGVPHISGKQINNFSFNRPPFKSQKYLVLKLELISKKMEELESLYKYKIANLNELKKSILQKAFNGELV